MGLNVEADVSRGDMGGGNPHTLHTKCEKQCNLHIKRGMLCQIQTHTQAYRSTWGGMQMRKSHTRILYISNVKNSVIYT